MTHWTDPGGALNIETAAELERFDLGTVKINRQTYNVLTGYEGPERRCFWCGGELKGKLRRYCRGHMKLYYRYFMWQSASHHALWYAGHRCENCRHTYKLEVHHIVPLNGEKRDFSHYNLPWNLIVFCHQCHQEVHAVMRGKPPLYIDKWQAAEEIGQSVMRLDCG